MSYSAGNSEDPAPGGGKYEEPWVPFSQTLVVHPPGLLGTTMGLLSLTPFAVGVGFMTLILFRRDLHTIFFFIGLCLNSVVNIILKPWIGQERPQYHENLLRYHGKQKEQSYGMPSHHSQFMWFFSFYMILFLMYRVKDALPKSSGAEAARQRWMVFLIFVATAASYSRVYLGYHTLAQVIGGAVVGIVTASLWFYYIQNFASPVFLKIMCCPLAQYLLLRDTTLIPNIMMFEYCNIQKATQHRARTRPDASKCTTQGSIFCASESNSGPKPSCKKHESCF